MTTGRGRRTDWLPLVRFGILYILLFLFLDRLGQITAISEHVSLWYPAAGLILGVVWRMRLVGVLLAILAGVAGFLLSDDNEFSAAGLIAYSVLSPVGALIVRGATRRLGYINARAMPRPQIALALIIAGAVFSVWNMALFHAISLVAPGGQHLDVAGSANWALGDFLGALAVYPIAVQLLFPLMLGQQRISISGIRKWLPRVLAYTMLSLIPVFAGHIYLHGQSLQLTFLVALPIFFAALHRGVGETSLALFFANLGFMIATREADPIRGIELQSMALFINVGGLLTAAITTNQNAMLKALHMTLAERDHLTSEKAEYEKRLAEGQRLDALGQMAGGLAHEINNLLHPIKSFARSAATAPDEKRQHYLNRINECADSAHRIVSDVLTFSRDAANSQHNELVLLPVRPALEAAIAIAANSLPSSIALTAAIEIGNESMRCSASGPSQILMNLFNNARDAMQGSGALHVSGKIVTLDETAAARDQVAEGRHLELKVTDTGPGIADELAARVFEPFFTTKDVGRGTGLGLSVVYGMVRRWGGSIRLDSQIGHGTTFILLIPVADN